MIDILTFFKDHNKVLSGAVQISQMPMMIREPDAAPHHHRSNPMFTTIKRPIRHEIVNDIEAHHKYVLP